METTGSYGIEKKTGLIQQRFSQKILLNSKMPIFNIQNGKYFLCNKSTQPNKSWYVLQKFYEFHSAVQFYHFLNIFAPPWNQAFYMQITPKIQI
jgi:hypothetical protein